MRHITSGIAATLAVLGMASCSQAKWKAEGTVAGGEGRTLVLEAPNSFGQWYPLDTIETDSKGRFKVSQEPSGHPEVFRLTMGKESLYFPVDSVETVTITADASHFGSIYTLAGSESAEKMQQVNELIHKVTSTQGEQAVAYDPELKRALTEAIMRDPAGIVAYYTIFRRVGDTPLFGLSDKANVRLMGAVANAFATKRPADPRTKFLKDLFISSRKALGAVRPDTIAAVEITLPEIELLDVAGKKRSLTAEASKGKVMVLNFTAYAAEGSPALNLELAKIYEANRAKGLEIYQVSVDNDEFQWRQAAENLPWIAVFNSPKDGASNLLRYNVTNLPATFIINRNGDLAERVDDPTRIASAVARYL